ncbi:hypothetical protein LTR56_000856 [Elasticomyces elasticus]|nr:hypothetical protein LTR22_018617 [Elasticomyces elasticus]KAK3660480.1 hypothetical protein LTR56_000856 [Elasticomyces elasticus]KAK4912282.1 hypothetical protein LTR49_019283 [Elasticomyces elasticus]KAK5751784.1 hypothetical protein LTS12_018112 [Elasticomyces elasticus]
MVTRRSTRVKGVKLNDDVTKLTAQARHQVLSSNRTALEVKYADVECRFNIFDIVPELRERIFYYAMDLEEPRRIANFKLPTLALEESSRPRYGGPRAKTLAELSYTHSGRISAFDFNGPNAKSLLARLKKREGSVACFRNVEMRFGGFSLGHLRTQATRDNNQFSLRIPTASKPRPTIESTVATTASVYQTELDMLRERAVTKAREIAGSRERFVGFTLQDLEEVIAEFAYWPV